MSINPMEISTIEAMKYHIPKIKRKTFSNVAGISPSLIIEAPLPKIAKKMNNKQTNSFLSNIFFFFFYFLFFLLNTFIFIMIEGYMTIKFWNLYLVFMFIPTMYIFLLLNLV